MKPSLQDEVIARVEENGVMVERKGRIVGRLITGCDDVRYDVYFADAKDSTKRMALNLAPENVRKA